jgi:hypothetical protein
MTRCVAGRTGYMKVHVLTLTGAWSDGERLSAPGGAIKTALSAPGDDRYSASRANREIPGRKRDRLVAVPAFGASNGSLAQWVAYVTPRYRG